jgi:biopolymer transport protein ExbD
VNLRPRRDRRQTDINLTPLIDVVFLLLIFFMVSTTFNRETEISIDLPQAGKAPQQTEEKVLELLIDARGDYHVGGEHLPDRHVDTVRHALAALAGDDLDRPLLIRADADTPHQAVITAMDAARRIGLTRLTFATQRVPGAE